MIVFDLEERGGGGFGGGGGGGGFLRGGGGGGTGGVGGGSRRSKLFTRGESSKEGGVSVFCFCVICSTIRLS